MKRFTVLVARPKTPEFDKIEKLHVIGNDTDDCLEIMMKAPGGGVSAAHLESFGTEGFTSDVSLECQGRGLWYTSSDDDAPIAIWTADEDERRPLLSDYTKTVGDALRLPLSQEVRTELEKKPRDWLVFLLDGGRIACVPPQEFGPNGWQLINPPSDKLSESVNKLTESLTVTRFGEQPPYVACNPNSSLITIGIGNEDRRASVFSALHALVNVLNPRFAPNHRD